MSKDMRGLRAAVARQAAGKAPKVAEAPAEPIARRDGLDFAALSRRLYEEATPEQKARMDAYDTERARVALTRAEIPATFERQEFRAGPRAGDRPVGYVAQTWSRPVGIQIEGEAGEEVLRFTEAVTGHESYRLDEDFCRLLEDPAENEARPRFYICAGTPGRWHGCSVDPADVAGYLRERRPELFADAAPSMGR